VGVVVVGVVVVVRPRLCSRCGRIGWLVGVGVVVWSSVC